MKSSEYVALGFSEDDKMGEDLVFYCTNSQPKDVSLTEALVYFNGILAGGPNLF